MEDAGTVAVHVMILLMPTCAAERSSDTVVRDRQLVVGLGVSCGCFNCLSMAPVFPESLFHTSRQRQRLRWLFNFLF